MRHSEAILRPPLRMVHCLNYPLWMVGLTDHLGLEAALDPETDATVRSFHEPETVERIAGFTRPD